MMLRSVIVAAALSFALSLPASAQMSQWGMWSDGAQLKKGKIGGLAAAPSMLGGLGATSQVPAGSVKLAVGGSKPNVAPQSPATVAFKAGYAAGSVVIDQRNRKLFYVLGNGSAYSYPVAVGKQGFTWTGTEKVSRIVDWPDWVPPKEMRARKPGLPVRMSGGVNNPLGAKAIYLGSTLYRIHGTNDPNSIGTAASSGCIRMNNAHVAHLAGLVSKGTSVSVVRSLGGKKTAANI